jgi:hypothetical protein
LEPLTRQAEELNDWVRTTVEILNGLRHDYECMKLKPPVRLFYAVDYYDVFLFASPFRPTTDDYSRKSKQPLSDVDRAVRAQAGRIAIFFGLPEEHYPHMLLLPYYREMREGLWSRKSRPSIPSYANLVGKLNEKVPNFSERLRTMQSNLQQLEPTKDIREEFGDVLGALTHIAPDLLYLVSNVYHNRAKLELALLDEGRLSADVESWPVYKLCKEPADRSGIVDAAQGLSTDPFWHRLFGQIRTGKEWEAGNINDSSALTILEKLNTILNPNGVAVLLISSTDSMQKVMRKAGDRQFVRFTVRGNQIKLPLVRDREAFRYYDRYRHQCKDPEKPAASEIVCLIEREMKRLESMDKEGTTVQEHIESLRSPVSTLYDIESVNILSAFVTNAGELRADLRKTHAIYDSSTYLKPYQRISPTVEELRDQVAGHIAVSETLEFTKVIVEILSDHGAYRAYILERILFLKCDLISEMFLLSGSSRVLTQPGEELTQPGEELTQPGEEFLIPIQRFYRLPHLIEFESDELRDDFRQLNELLYDPREAIDSDTVRSVLDCLRSMALKIASCQYWRKDGDARKGTQIQTELLQLPERLLVSYTFLLILGGQDLVLSGIAELLDNEKTGLRKEYTTSEYGLLQGSFVLLHVLAELEVEQGKLSKNEYFETLREVRQNVLSRFAVTGQAVLKDPNGLRHIDARLLYVFALIAGTGSYTKRMLKGWNLEAVIALRRLTVQELERRAAAGAEASYGLKVSMLDVAKTNLSYCLALSSTEEDIRNAAEIDESIESLEENMFQGCLHARGFVRLRLATIEEDTEKKRQLLKEAKAYFETALGRRTLGVPGIFLKDRLIQDIKDTDKAIRELDGSKRQ